MKDEEGEKYTEGYQQATADFKELLQDIDTISFNWTCECDTCCKIKERIKKQMLVEK